MMSLSEPCHDTRGPIKLLLDFPIRMVIRSLALHIWLQLEGGWRNCPCSIARFAPGLRNPRLSPTVSQHYLLHSLCHLHKHWAATKHKAVITCSYYWCGSCLGVAVRDPHPCQNCRGSDIHLSSHWLSLIKIDFSLATCTKMFQYSNN